MRYRTYAEQTTLNPNPMARFAHTRRHLVAVATCAEFAARSGTLLDYGCGEGAFLTSMAEVRPDLQLLGYDPFSNHAGGVYKKISSLEELADNSVEVLSCFETLEHLSAGETRDLLGFADRVLTSPGYLIISVPIIGGLPLVLKEASRAMLFRRRSDYTFPELLGATFLGRPAKRADDIKASHKGYDFRETDALISARYTRTLHKYSPFQRLPWWLNSQVFQVYAR